LSTLTRGLFTKRQNRICADHTPCAIWRKHTLRAHSMPRNSAAPLYRDGCRQTRPVTSPVQSAWPALLRLSAASESLAFPQRNPISSRRVNLPHQRCVDALALARGRQSPASRRECFDMTDYNQIVVERTGEAATIRMLPREQYRGAGASHWEIGLALHELRFDHGIRVIVVTGTNDVFHMPPKESPHPGRGIHVPGRDFDAIQGMHQTFEQFLEIEKPIIAKVNGPAVGWGSSLVFACDFIVAREDAIICDHHLAMGETFRGGSTEFGCVAGDGGTAFCPMHMPPGLPKDYPCPPREMPGRGLATRGIITPAVPAAELAGKVDAMIAALLRRPPYSPALSKRALNRLYVE